MTLTISATFVAALGWQAFTVATIGLLIGGVAAAPMGAFIARRAKPRMLLGVVGSVLTLTSAYGIVRGIA